ncbi:HypC/HybG/HupF family hydrogenase formation chaperone [Candidatus Dojkabacteria bacterium]|nr:HypC/HybG/HupF family hydrogenase formation chaperone [Candidatus Dojkabacteria bacterium]
MCLSIPAKIVSISGRQAEALVGGVKVNISLELVDGVEKGDFVLVHTGFALQKLDEKEAKETLDLLDEFME